MSFSNISFANNRPQVFNFAGGNPRTALNINQNARGNALYGQSNAYMASGGQNIQSLLSTLMGMFNGLFSQYGQGTPNYGNGGGYNYNPPAPPPQTECPPPPPVCPPPPPPVCEEPEKVLGSAGLFGDPMFGLFTPGLENVPDALKSFDSGIGNGQTVTLLKDSDLGGLEVTGTGVQVDPSIVNSTAIGTASFKSGNDVVTIGGDGKLIVNGQNKGNIRDAGFIAPITLPSGLKVSTENAIDGANGATAERFVIQNGEYRITAAVRSPHPDSRSYLDMNFEELVADAADNATGYRVNVPGQTQQFGIADLLRLEPGMLG